MSGRKCVDCLDGQWLKCGCRTSGGAFDKIESGLKLHYTWEQHYDLFSLRIYHDAAGKHHYKGMTSYSYVQHLQESKK